MKKSGAALCVLALFALAAADAWAGGRSGGGYHHGGARYHHHGARARVFISSPFFFFPRPYYYYPAPAYVAPAAPVEYIQQDPGPESQYWYYCPGSGAYYPYVNECPGGWRLVQPAGEAVRPSFPG